MELGAIYAENGVSYLISAGYNDIKQTGIATGTESGKLLEKNFSAQTCNSFDGDGVLAEINNTDGDSGQFTYRYDSYSDTVGLIYLHARWYDKYNNKYACNGNDRIASETAGTAMYRLDDEWDITWVWS